MEIHTAMASHSEALASAAVRRRGRPPGARQPVTCDVQLGNHHFAFLRAVTFGLDPTESAERYLFTQERIDPRTARVLQRELLERVMELARATDDLEVRRSAAELGRAEESSPPVVNLAVQAALPSLDEFADTLESDMYGESELIALYKEQYGSANTVTDTKTTNAKVHALDFLQGRLARIPCGHDATAVWLPPSLCKVMCLHGILTLDDLVAFINGHGRTWFTKISRLGRTRAARMTAWLVGIQATCNQKIHRDILEQTDSLQLGALQTALVPLEQFFVPKVLDGENGVFRGHAVNTLGANSDPQAIHAWFKLLSNNSVHTRIAYTREVERFYLWSVLEKRKAMSSLDALDCAAFVDFLKAPPAHWIQSLPYPRIHPRWRPLRGALNDASIKRCLAAVSRLFQELVEAGYLRANPMPRMNIGAAEAIQFDVMRSFTVEDQACLSQALHSMPERPAGRRARALSLLLLSTGLRSSEACGHTAQSIEVARQENRLSDGYMLRIIGKGKKERLIPLREDVLKALRAHHADLSAANPSLASMPLIGTLKPAPGSHSVPIGSPLSTSGMYHVLKSLFRRAAGYTHQDGQADFEKSSAHWLRHTFAHGVLAATDNDLTVVKELLGHASIQTTAIYVKANLKSRTIAVNAMVSPLFERNTP